MPFIPLIAAGIGAGTTIGLDLSNQPSTPKVQAPTPTPASTTPDSTQEAAARLSASNTQASAPGVSSGYLGQNISSTLGLSPDSPVVQQILNQLGIGGATTAGVGGGSSLTTTPQGNAVSGTNPLTDFLASNQGTGATGGLTNDLLQQNFKGFS